MKPDQLYGNLLDHLSEGVYFVDGNRVISYWNQAAERITGYRAEEVVGRHCHENILRHVSAEGEELCLDGCPLHDTITDGESRKVATVFLHHRQGHRVPISVQTLPLVGSDGKITGAVEIFSDKRDGEDLQRRIEDLRQKLLLDGLTQLPNRQHAERDIKTRFFSMQNGGSRFGVLFIDIDHFKNINDTHGHDVGDMALKVAASTLRNNIRPGDLVARWGGEEFVGVFSGVDPDGLLLVATKIVMLMRNSQVHLEDSNINFTVSIGATAATSKDDLTSIIKRADALMYKSKKAGRDRVTLG